MRYEAVRAGTILVISIIGLEASMISTIVLVTGADDEPPVRCRELSVRSLAWLVPAVVTGVVRDVVAACPTSWPVEDIMDHAGCGLVRAAGEAERLAAAIALAKCQRILLVRIGFHPEGPLATEIDALERSPSDGTTRLLLLAPSRLVERLFPDRAPAVGLLADRDRLRSASQDYRGLIRNARGAIRLRTRMVPVL